MQKYKNEENEKMKILLQQIITGISIGSIYALIASGYALVYSLLDFSNWLTEKSACWVRMYALWLPPFRTCRTGCPASLALEERQ